MPLPSTSTEPSLAVLPVITTGAGEVRDFLVVGVGAVVEVGADGCAAGVTLVFDDPQAARMINAERPSAYIFICIARDYGPGGPGVHAPPQRDLDLDRLSRLSRAAGGGGRASRCGAARPSAAGGS